MFKDHWHIPFKMITRASLVLAYKVMNVFLKRFSNDTYTLDEGIVGLGLDPHWCLVSGTDHQARGCSWLEPVYSVLLCKVGALQPLSSCSGTRCYTISPHPLPAPLLSPSYPLAVIPAGWPKQTRISSPRHLSLPLNLSSLTLTHSHTHTHSLTHINTHTHSHTDSRAN